MGLGAPATPLQLPYRGSFLITAFFIALLKPPQSPTALSTQSSASTARLCTSPVAPAHLRPALPIQHSPRVACLPSCLRDLALALPLTGILFPPLSIWLPLSLLQAPAQCWDPTCAPGSTCSRKTLCQCPEEAQGGGVRSGLLAYVARPQPQSLAWEDTEGPAGGHHLVRPCMHLGSQ